MTNDQTPAIIYRSSASVAQLVEQLIRNQQVAGPSPATSSRCESLKSLERVGIWGFSFLTRQRLHGKSLHTGMFFHALRVGPGGYDVSGNLGGYVRFHHAKPQCFPTQSRSTPLHNTKTLVRRSTRVFALLMSAVFSGGVRVSEYR